MLSVNQYAITWGAKPFADQASSAHEMPDHERTDEADRDHAHAEQAGHGPAHPRPRLGTVQKSTQLSPSWFGHRFGSRWVFEGVAEALSEGVEPAVDVREVIA